MARSVRRDGSCVRLSHIRAVEVQWQALVLGQLECLVLCTYSYLLRSRVEYYTMAFPVLRALWHGRDLCHRFGPRDGKRTNRGEAVDRSMGQLSFTEIGQSAVGEDGEYYFTAAAIEPRDRKRLGLPLREDTSSEDLRWWQRLDFFLIGSRGEEPHRPVWNG